VRPKRESVEKSVKRVRGSDIIRIVCTTKRGGREVGRLKGKKVKLGCLRGNIWKRKNVCRVKGQSRLGMQNIDPW